MAAQDSDHGTALLSKARFSQSSVNMHFSNARLSVFETVYAIEKGLLNVHQLPPLRLHRDGNEYYTLDNRRLWVYKHLSTQARRGFPWEPNPTSAEEVVNKIRGSGQDHNPRPALAENRKSHGCKECLRFEEPNGMRPGFDEHIQQAHISPTNLQVLKQGGVPVRCATHPQASLHVTHRCTNTQPCKIGKCSNKYKCKKQQLMLVHSANKQCASVVLSSGSAIFHLTLDQLIEAHVRMKSELKCPQQVPFSSNNQNTAQAEETKSKEEEEEEEEVLSVPGQDQNQHFVIRLGPELVPRKVWAKNYKPSIPPDLWAAVRMEQMRRCGNRCEICSSQDTDDNKLILHQKWEQVLGGKNVVRFVDFEVLCWACHDVRHLGWSGIEGRGTAAFQHLLRVNVAGVPKQHMEKAAHAVMQHVEMQGTQWAERANLHWDIDFLRFRSLPSVRQWLQATGRGDVGRFGSLCLVRDHNLNPQPQAHRH